MATEATTGQSLIGSTGEEMLGHAIALTLQAPPLQRANLIEQLLGEIVTAAASPGMRPWVYFVHDGSDGSRVFRGGVGTSIVVDPDGRLWRARTYEDFDTTYTITATSCEIATMSPKYTEMREYLPR